MKNGQGSVLITCEGVRDCVVPGFLRHRGWVPTKVLRHHRPAQSAGNGKVYLLRALPLTDVFRSAHDMGSTSMASVAPPVPAQHRHVRPLLPCDVHLHPVFQNEESS